MSSLSLSYQSKEENTQNKNISSKPLFNSKLFLDLDINQDEINDLNNIKEPKEDSDYSNELFEPKNFLSNELIKDLNGSISNDNDIKEIKEIKDNNEKNNYENIDKKNIINLLISLAKDGYEFKPKNYKPDKEQENNSRNANVINNKFNKNKFNKRIVKKNDWICPFCNNLNFSFRIACNKCKIRKISPNLNVKNNNKRSIL